MDISVSGAANRPTKKINDRGIYLEPDEKFVGPTPLNVRSGTATLGVHDGRPTNKYPESLVDGKITISELLIYADEFDEGEGKYSAREFLVSLLPDVVGTDERDRHIEARAALIKQASGE